MKNYLFGAILGFCCLLTKAQNTFYDPTSIQKIEVFISDPNWDYKMDTLAIGTEGYLLIDSVRINGVSIDSVGIKYKGNSSYDSSKIKNPIHLALDEFADRNFQGITDIKLSNCYSDPSMIREVLAYDVLQKYMDCPRSNFAQLFINGNLIGLYSNDESINKSFCGKVFNSTQNVFIKCNPLLNPGPNTKSNLKYLGADTSSYLNYYEIKSKSGWKDLVRLCDTVSNYQNSLATIFDIDRLLWMLAFNNLLVNLDSYSGVFCQNYYLYRDQNNRYCPIVWDLNMAWGGFPYLGVGNSSMGSLSVTNMQQMGTVIHPTDTYWPLINATMGNSSWRKKYFAHLRTMETEMISSGAYLTQANELRSLIDTAVLSDPNKMYTYQQFQDALTSNITNGSYSIPGISVLMSGRSTYLNSQTEFMKQGPVLSEVKSSISIPALNDSIWISVHAGNAQTVQLNYRANSFQSFQSISMYDDGKHQDGLANDSVFGAMLVQNATQIQYYIYAENADAGKFSPARAEHEFYASNIPETHVLPGELMINEVLANNKKSDINESGLYEDWIELYNTTDKTLSLANLYLSDKLSIPKLYSFPAGAIIKPNAYLIVWADERNNTSKYLHANFKLSSEGDAVYLSNQNGLILDSVNFGAQEEDISWGRCPNASGPFSRNRIPTFQEKNVFCSTGLSVWDNSLLPIVFPNPCSGNLLYSNPLNKAVEISLFQASGQKVLESKMERGEGLLDLSSLPEGLYYYQIGKWQTEPVKTGKIVIINAK